MDLMIELNKATADMSPEGAEKLATEVRESIRAREQNNSCACGTPCTNRHSHNAIDQLTLMALEKITGDNDSAEQ